MLDDAKTNTPPKDIVQGDFWASLVEILVFPRPTRHMLTYFGISLLD